MHLFLSFSGGPNFAIRFPMDSDLHANDIKVEQPGRALARESAFLLFLGDGSVSADVDLTPLHQA